MSDQTAKAKAAQEHLDTIDTVLFKRNLDEVFLLLDFVSGRPDKDLSKLTVPDPATGVDFTAQQVVARLADIRYPPAGEATLRSANASFVLLAKDRLTALASPARGQTIAYTALFSGAEFMGGMKNWRPGKRDSTQSSSDATRLTLAVDAFPSLGWQVAKFNVVFVALLICTMLWLLVASITYWDVALGRSYLQRIDQVQKDRTALYQAVPALVQSVPAAAPTPAANVPAPGPAVPTVQVAPAAAEPVSTPDKAASVPAELVARPRAVVCQRITAENAPNCNKLDDLSEAEDSAKTELAHFSDCAASGCWRILHPLHWGFGFDDAHHRSSVDEQPLSALLSLFSNYILPVMFGVLGTFIAAIRAIQSKVRDSELSPRDLWSTVMALPLGMVAGVAVGLFFSPSTAPATGGGGTTLAGNLTMTASGLGFLAGYGSQAFFTMLDALQKKAFPSNGVVATPVAAPSSGRPPSPTPSASKDAQSAAGRDNPTPPAPTGAASVPPTT